MDYFITKIKKNERNLHFLVYCYTFFIYGAIFNGIGPLIPYCSFQYGNLETQYSILFLGRTFGYIIGAISTKILITKFRYHTLMTYAVIGVSLSAIAFNFCSNIYLQTFWIGINTLIIAYYDVIGNTSLLIFNKDSDKQFWVQIAHSMFGVGNLTAPLIVYFSQLNTFLCLGILNIISVYGYWVLQSPEIKNQNSNELLTIKKQNSLKIVSKLQNTQEINKNLVQSQNQTLKTLQINNQIRLLLATLFFIYIGHELSFGTWIPSYSVLMKFSQKNEATIYSLIYYLTMTIARFILATMPTNNQTSKRIKLFLIGNLIVSLIGLFFYMTFPHFGCYLVSILYGIVMAPLFSLYFVISNDYGFELKASDYSTIMILSVFGEAIFATLVGYLLQISLSMIFISVLILALLQYYFIIKLQVAFQNQVLNNKQKLLQ